MSAQKSEVLHAALDLMILKTLHALGALHGFGIARRNEKISESVPRLNEGTVYSSLLGLQQQGWIESPDTARQSTKRAEELLLSKTCSPRPCE